MCLIDIIINVFDKMWFTKVESTFPYDPEDMVQKKGAVFTSLKIYYKFSYFPYESTIFYSQWDTCRHAF